MSAQVNRRSFLRSTLAAASLPLIGRFAIASPDGLNFDEDERTAWYRAAKFGMFIHWGPYSLASVEASWPIMEPAQWGITEAEYRALPARFNPVHYDPDHFIDMARTAGQKYMVFTTKHHDGFCMFDSAYTKYKITNTPYGKDIVKQLADACARRAMPLGFYEGALGQSRQRFGLAMAEAVLGIGRRQRWRMANRFSDDVNRSSAESASDASIATEWEAK